MMAKITKGSSFGGAVKYILDPKKQTERLGADGLRLKNLDSITRSFEAQAKLSPRVARSVGHISLDFSAQDREKLDSVTMVQIALDYMNRMGIQDTQFIIGRHHDREHPHIHLLYNRVDNNGHTISDQNDRLRSGKICKELTQKYGLYFADGKENVKRHRLREPDATKYKIYDALVRHVPQSSSWNELERRLKAESIEVGFKTKGSTSLIEGVRFTANNLTFNGSKVDRQFSYSKIDYALKQNTQQEQQSLQPTPHSPTIQTHTVAEEAGSILGGLFDIPLDTNGIDHEEEQFRRRMQKKKRQRRI